MEQEKCKGWAQPIEPLHSLQHRMSWEVRP